MKNSVLFSLIALCSFGIAKAKNCNNTLVNAVKNEEVARVKELLEQDNTEMNHFNPTNNKHILIIAIELNNIKLVKTIIESNQIIPIGIWVEAYELSNKYHKTINKIIKRKIKRTSREIMNVCNIIAIQTLLNVGR